ncbi:MAG: nucleotidyltransferase domain-containing protein [Bacteroidota bacterium]
MDQRDAINKGKAYKQLLSRYFPFSQVFLFGSYAKGNFHENSDIDIAIVVDHAEGDYFAIQPFLFKLRRQIDSRIEPVLIEREHDAAGFLDEIIKSGIEIK